MTSSVRCDSLAPVLQWAIFIAFRNHVPPQTAGVMLMDTACTLLCMIATDVFSDRVLSQLRHLAWKMFPTSTIMEHASGSFAVVAPVSFVLLPLFQQLMCSCMTFEVTFIDKEVCILFFKNDILLQPADCSEMIAGGWGYGILGKAWTVVNSWKERYREPLMKSISPTPNVLNFRQTIVISAKGITYCPATWGSAATMLCDIVTSSLVSPWRMGHWLALHSTYLLLLSPATPQAASTSSSRENLEVTGMYHVRHKEVTSRFFPDHWALSSADLCPVPFPSKRSLWGRRNRGVEPPASLL